MAEIDVLRNRVITLETSDAVQAASIATLEMAPSYDPTVLEALEARVIAIEGELSNPS